MLDAEEGPSLCCRRKLVALDRSAQFRAVHFARQVSDPHVQSGSKMQVVGGSQAWVISTNFGLKRSPLTSPIAFLSEDSSQQLVQGKFFFWHMYLPAIFHLLPRHVNILLISLNADFDSSYVTLSELSIKCCAALARCEHLGGRTSSSIVGARWLNDRAISTTILTVASRAALEVSCSS